MKHTHQLLDIMARLRHPESGCPWDLKQDFASLIPYTLEEAYEVADAAERGDPEDLREELGDLLLQVVFHSRIAEEQGLFRFEDVALGVSDKLVRRHPHVFGGTEFESDEDRQRYWEESKLTEKRARGKTEATGALSGLPLNLPALMYAQKLQQRAARHGFDWPNVEGVFDKVREELRELQDAQHTASEDDIREEIGDLLFVIVNLARHSGIDAESALRDSNRKFHRRFNHIENRLAGQGKRLSDAGLPEMDALWDEAKSQEKQPPGSSSG